MSASSPPNPTRPARPRQHQRGRVAQLGPRFWHCPACRAVVAIHAKEDHVCAPPAGLEESSATSNNTPLDLFFLSYVSFQYDRSLPPADSFHRLQRSQRWRRGSPESDEAWDRYQRALKQEFQLWYGAEEDLGAWHALCRAIRIEPLPKTCQSCKKAVRNRHVNLVDLIEWGRNGGESGGPKVRIFRSVRELSEYSKKTHKIFRNDLDERSEDGGVVLRHLLRRLFS